VADRRWASAVASASASVSASAPWAAILASLGNPRGRTHRFAVAPSPQRGTPCCSFRLGEGPALQLQSANARLLVDRHFLGGLNLIQMLVPHNELPLMVGGVGGITPLDIPPIPPLYSLTRGNARNEESPAAASRLS
jgi:hypothetical protein